MSEQTEAPLKDETGKVIGKIISWAFDVKTQSFSITAELNDGTRIEGTVPV